MPTTTMSSTPHRELEAKFQLTSPHQLPALLDAIRQGGFDMTEQGTHDQRDTYLDTPAYDLLRTGYALRVRQDHGPRRIGLKSLSSDTGAVVQSRIDLEAPLHDEENATDPTAWPTLVTEELGPLLPRLTLLRPIAVIRQTRHKLAIGQADSANLAEWSLDEVHIYAPDRPEAPLTTFHELELELLDEERASEFAAFVHRVRVCAGLQPLATSKLERALPALVAAAHDSDATITADMLLGEACRRILHEQLVRLLLTEHDVRAGNDPEAVHDARVAIRRARAALRLLGGQFRRSAVTRTSRALARLGRKLGAVRDLDVGLENLRLFRKQLAKPQRKTLKELRAALEAHRHSARRDLLDYLNHDEHRSGLVAALDLASTPGASLKRAKSTGPEVLPRQVRHTLPSIVLRAFEAVRAYETVFSAEALPPLETFHALRICAKYLRYSLEFAGPLLSEPGDRLIAQLKELQEHLGRLNDAHVERERLRVWSTDIGADTAISLRLQAVEDDIAALCAAAPALLARFVAPETRALLGQALARI